MERGARNRNIYISVAVFACILFSIGSLVRDSEAAVHAVVVIAFIACYTVLYTLDGRQQRREREHGRGAEVPPPGPRTKP